jgi:tetratricopeptide (TPR) repeat protein
VALDHALALARTLGLTAQATWALRARGGVALRLGRHAEAWAALSEVADGAVGADEPAAVVELRWQLGTAALALGRSHDAQRWLEAALALDPAHRPSRRALVELDGDRPEALLGHHHALLAGAPLDEQAALWTAIGDLYAGPLADRALAADAYRQALALAPEDPRLLHKCLDVCVALAAWSDTLPLLEQLIAGERVPKVRAKYAQAAGLILYDELHRTAEAERYLVAAVDEDATLERAAAALEEILSARADWTALANLSCVRLQRLGPAGSVEEKRVRARLWAQLGALCAERLGDRDSAVAAFEVAARFDPADVHSHRQLAALYGEARIERAIAEQRLVVAAEPAAAEAYAALERLFARAGDDEAAAGCARARRLVEGGDLDDVAPAPLLRAAATLRPATWAQLAHPAEDGHVAALLALVTPAVVAAHAQPPRQHGLDKKERVDPNDPRAFARVLRYVARVLGVPAPDAYVRYEQPAPTQLVACLDGRRAVPTLVIGRPLLGHRRDERELIFHLAEALAYLRPGRLLGCLGAPAAQLAQLIDAAMALAGNSPAQAAPLRAILPPPHIEQATGLGRALAERHVDGGEAALAWLRATELSAGRTALLLTGDLALCARLVGEAPACAVPAAERRIDLAAASVGSALTAARVELRLAPANGAATPLPPPLRITAV